MRRVLLSVSILSALVALPTGAVAKYKIGISDQTASTFTNPLYAPLHLSLARYITPYDVMAKEPGERTKLQAWITGARGAHQRILVAFEASHLHGHQRHIPSVAEYRKAIKA